MRERRKNSLLTIAFICFSKFEQAVSACEASNSRVIVMP